jgi:hypothetical protein
MRLAVVCSWPGRRPTVRTAVMMIFSTHSGVAGARAAAGQRAPPPASGHLVPPASTCQARDRMARGPQRAAPVSLTPGHLFACTGVVSSSCAARPTSQLRPLRSWIGWRSCRRCTGTRTGCGVCHGARMVR